MNTVDNIMDLADLYAMTFGDNRNDATNRQELKAAIEQALAARVPAGWKLVPINLSDGMHNAFDNIRDEHNLVGIGPGEFWDTMLAAAPQPAQQSECDTPRYCNSVQRCTAMDTARATPQTKWVELSDDEIESGRHKTFSTSNPFCPCDSKTMRKAVRWAEAKLREKNGGV